jgi:hypothetical protein
MPRGVQRSPAEPRSRPGANYEEDRRLHAADSRNLIVKWDEEGKNPVQKIADCQ